MTVKETQSTVEIHPAMPARPAIEIGVTANPRRYSRLLLSLAAVLLLGIGIIVVWFGLRRERPQDTFWAPLKGAGDNVTVCVGQVSWPGGPPSSQYRSPVDQFDDDSPLARE
jgi:hypothetical protein